MDTEKFAIERDAHAQVPAPTDSEQGWKAISPDDDLEESYVRNMT